MSPHFPRLSSPVARGGAMLGALALVALLAGCGAVSASGAQPQATATCPTTPSFTVVSGAVTSVSPGTMSVKETSGASVTLALASTTRYTVTTSVAPTSLTAGEPVLVLTDTNATTARSVRVLPTTTGGGTGGFGGGFGGARGTPRPGANRGCARRGGFGGGAGGSPSGTGFQGLRGTVDSASATNLTFDDAQGQTYSVAITSTTTITKSAAGTASSVTVGASVQVAAQKTNGQLIARTVNVAG